MPEAPDGATEPEAPNGANVPGAGDGAGRDPGSALGLEVAPGPQAAPGPEAAPPGGRSPGWREVLGVAVLVLAVVFAVEILSALVPPVREAFRGFPVTIIVLVAGTIGLLVAIALRRPRP